EIGLDSVGRPGQSSQPQRAGVAQLVERNLAKVEVASSNLVSRSRSSAATATQLRPARLAVGALVRLAPGPILGSILAPVSRGWQAWRRSTLGAGALALAAVLAAPGCRTETHEEAAPRIRIDAERHRVELF